MKYLSLDKLKSEKNTDMNCDISVSLNKDAEIVVTNKNFFQNFRLKKARRYRSAFTTEQINYLEQKFKKFPYIGNTDRKEVANILEITEKAVKIWFQNRRMKEKREINGNKDLLIEDKNNIYNSYSQELLSNRNIKFNNYSNSNASLLSNQKNKSKETRAKNRKTQYNFSNKSVLTNQIKENSFKNTNISNYNQNRTTDLTIDNRKSNIFNSLMPPKMRSETTKLLATPLKPIHKNTSHLNDVNKEFTSQESNAKHLHSKKESEVPQDLTMNNSEKKDHQQFYLDNSNMNQRLVPIYTQGYYSPHSVTTPSTFHSGNIIWKPVNVMPMAVPGLAACSPLSMTPNCSGISLSNQEMSKEACNCRSSSQVFEARSQCVAGTQPQYIFAFPFNNSSNKI